ncbi:ComF family protein [Peptoniphilus asaccharolyticus]|uniref:ComF family protein n=1 Tax=Peptoniphilus asaccharolyticus TaxID=1258 RepID=UPI001180DBC6|nr:phosphoribosyltransferase family protein [Peptoniphilus asaccharolyticus]MBL7575830.1 ComF family protein [Peptoniphilus asaccharolyticus]MBL7575954.1 ComF family protein [Peptoniphilus asaccharolyticus]
MKLNVIWDRELENVDKVIVGGEYVGLLREILIDFKFRDCVYYADVLSEIMSEKLLKSRIYREYEAITYVPMHKVDLLERGYNQSEILAKKIADNVLLDFVEPIEKIKSTKRQIEVTSSERYRNLKGVFRVVDRLPENIILVDDVVTTGSTVDEIAKVLKENGVKKVAALIATTHNI